MKKKKKKMSPRQFERDGNRMCNNSVYVGRREWNEQQRRQARSKQMQFAVSYLFMPTFSFEIAFFSIYCQPEKKQFSISMREMMILFWLPQSRSFVFSFDISYSMQHMFCC